MIAPAGAARMELDPLATWWQPGAMALLLVDLQQGTCGDAQPRSRPAFDAQFRAHTLPAAPARPRGGAPGRVGGDPHGDGQPHQRRPRPQPRLQALRNGLPTLQLALTCLGATAFAVYPITEEDKLTWYQGQMLLSIYKAFEGALLLETII